MWTKHLADPFGPGSASWNAFDRALVAAQRGQGFAQRRGEMRHIMKRQGATPDVIEKWTRDLEARVASQDYDD